MPEDAEFKHILRVANTDLDGNKPILSAMKKIKGVSFMFANMVCKIAKIDEKKKVGYLSDEDAKVLDDIIRNPLKYNAPVWMLNRRKDYETGEDKHINTGDIDFYKGTDIKRLKVIKSYKGVRHSEGQPVRGQRTKSNFRKNKGKVMGVKRKTAMPGKEEGKESKKKD
ncbi:MAG: 30S ribosomal protein S13 [Candidatus Woesearchaeota archaeon]|nr:30S ribosomal protein S13 [Candidatus Woesearchaeota archaeon]